MHVMALKQWQGGFPDYHRGAGQVRVDVRAWWSLRPIRGLFIERQRDWRVIWNYLGEIGLRAVILKVLARSSESLRNRRVFAVGLGVVSDADAGAAVAAGAPVAFVAPQHPACVERIVLPAELLRPVPQALLDRLAPAGGIRYIDRARDDVPCFDELAGWSGFSGRPVPPCAAELLAWAAGQWEAVEPDAGTVLPLPQGETVAEVLPPTRPQPASGKLTGVVFGYGNHARTMLMPNVGRRIQVTRVHELDPTLYNAKRDAGLTFDTSPDARDEERFDVYFVAGFHHTHAALAAGALRQGAWAVVEKPLITTEEELDLLLAALREHPGRLFACFHMRYNPLWELAREDLGVPAGEPIHYNCLVYEIKVPPLHWYTWPTAHSRIVSNCCHWLDHFLFMNGFSPVVRRDLWLGRNEDVHLSVELDNGACMSMCLTDNGSPRIGMQDTIELRAGLVTARVHNAGHYMAEDARRVLRRARFRKLNTFRVMYSAIAERIAAGRSGESIESVERTSRLMLDMESLYQQAKAELAGGAR